LIEARQVTVRRDPFVIHQVATVWGGFVRLDPLLRRAFTVIVTIVLVTTIANNIPNNSDGDSSLQSGYRLVSIPALQVTATGNCLDAQVISGRAAALAKLLGQGTTDLRLQPTLGCASSGNDIVRYRLQVHTADLVITMAPSDWAAAGADYRRAVVTAQLRSLRMLYPKARITVSILAGARVVMRVNAGQV
jgi:hypothetical protein